MNKQYRFKRGDIVISGNMVGTVQGLCSVGGVLSQLRVELMDSGAIKYFDVNKTKLIEFDSSRPSNIHLETLVKGKREEVEKTVKTKVLTIDELLDRYNDAKALYEEFGDKEYKKGMDSILKKLELASRGVKIMETTKDE